MDPRRTQPDVEDRRSEGGEAADSTGGYLGMAGADPVGVEPVVQAKLHCALETGTLGRVRWRRVSNPARDQQKARSSFVSFVLDDTENLG
jgi:hypothetical protein